MKTQLLERICNELRSQLDRLTRAAQEAHAAATDPGSKAEGKYDTRSLEASYLAVGQARQVAEIAEALRIFEALTLPSFSKNDEIDAGALVVVDLHGENLRFLMVPASGGLVVEHEGMEVTLLTPDSGLYRSLLEMRVGDTLAHPDLRVTGLS
jgi:hypothetical protein